MEKTLKFQMGDEGPTNLCQHSTTDLATGLMTNEHEQSALSKVRSSNILKLQAAFCIQCVTNKQVKLVSFT